MNKKHFSLSDWDLRPGHNMRINSSYYVSGPSCLEFGTPGQAFRFNWIMLKAAIAPCVPEGRIVNYFRASPYIDRLLYHLFRTQALPTNGYPDNCYWLNFGHTTYSLRKRIAAVDTLLAGGSLPNPFTSGAFEQYRLTWYDWITALFVPYFRIALEKLIAGEWIEQFHYDDPVSSWKESAVNLVGFSTYTRSFAEFNMIDDAEIWKKT